MVSPQGAGQQLSAVLASSNPVVRMRAIALVIGLGAQSEKSVKALQQSGECYCLYWQPMLIQAAEVANSLTCRHCGCSLRQHVLQLFDLAGQRLPVRGEYASCMYVMAYPQILHQLAQDLTSCNQSLHTV